MAPNPYVTMPQDDVAQIDQIIKEYEAEPAKGLAHGVQKDAIQNAFGARLLPKEVEACKEWAFTMELKTICGKKALVLHDEGTHGLTGDLLTNEEIVKKITTHELDDPKQRLGRFLARFVSGGNQGPGLFGRGKLIFHGASKTSSILVDSRRSDDGKYLAFDRKVRGSELVQPMLPYEDEEAKTFLAKESGGALKPLTKPGTRVTILDVKDEVADGTMSDLSGLLRDERTGRLFLPPVWADMLPLARPLVQRQRARPRLHLHEVRLQVQTHAHGRAHHATEDSTGRVATRQRGCPPPVRGARSRPAEEVRK